MQFRIGEMLVLLMLAAFASLASGQVVDAVGLEPVVDWGARIESYLTVWLPRLVMLAGVLTAIFPSGNKVMRIVDAFAINWGKARNDPDVQTWGK